MEGSIPDERPRTYKTGPRYLLRDKQNINNIPCLYRNLVSPERPWFLFVDKPCCAAWG